MIKAQGPDGYLSTDKVDWTEYEDTELVKALNDVTGNMYGEPAILVAMRDEYGQVTVFGVDSVDCYEQVSGEYVPVAQYDEDPESYELI
ncbi:hypothetical protein [Deinococcus sp.]|uniref:hypothetical protein n=1 Tax=Deinococcus sp. TaxID=47478 RepID=UPI003CC66A2C